MDPLFTPTASSAVVLPFSTSPSSVLFGRLDVRTDIVCRLIDKTATATYTDVHVDNNKRGQLAWRSSAWSEAGRMVHRMELKIRCSWSSDRQNATSNLNEPHDASRLPLRFREARLNTTSSAHYRGWSSSKWAPWGHFCPPMARAGYPFRPDDPCLRRFMLMKLCFQYLWAMPTGTDKYAGRLVELRCMAPGSSSHLSELSDLEQRE